MTLTTAALAAVAVGSASAQVSQDDIVVGLGTGQTATSFPTTNWTKYWNGSSWTNGPGPSGPEPTYAAPDASWDMQYVQSIEFDNFGGISHNAQGNLLLGNFGSGWTGFGVYDGATDGTDNVAGETNFASAYTNAPTNVDSGFWSIKDLTGGPTGFPAPYTVTGVDGSIAVFNGTERGGNLAVNPTNTKIAWAGFDQGGIFVSDYNGGTNPSAAGADSGGTGPSISGTRVTARGDRAGGQGTSSALAASTTTGVHFMNADLVYAFDKLGRVVAWDTSNVAAGNDNGVNPLVASVNQGANANNTFQPTPDAGWRDIANTGTAENFQNTDILYDPEVDSEHVYAAATSSGSFLGELFRWDLDTTTGDLTNLQRYALPATTPDGAYEPREISFDSQGNLIWSNFAGGGGNDVVVAQLTDATNDATWASQSAIDANLQTLLVDSQFTGFNGIDTATDDVINQLFGDYNGDGLVDTADFTVWSSNFGWIGVYNAADANFDGVIDTADFTVWSSNFGAPLPSSVVASLSSMGFVADGHALLAVPEPASLALVAAGALGVLRRRRSA